MTSDELAASDAWDQAAEVCAEHLLEGCANEIPNIERAASEFSARHLKRWSQSLRIVEAFLQTTTSVGNEINQSERPMAAARGDARFEALVRNHARAIQVAREIFVLATNGYSSGALSRWRTLHEIAVTSRFLDQREPEVSERYLLHDVVESRDSAREHDKYKDRLRCEAPTPEELTVLEEYVSALRQRFGRNFDRPNGWAQGYVPGLGDSDKVTFFALEKCVELDHWRPRYKLASQAVHSPSKSGYWSLSAGSMREFLLVGASSEGLADVLHPMMISANIVTSCLAMNWPSEGRLILLRALIVLARRGGAALLREDGQQGVPSQHPL